jgi:DNA-binding LacI/PurR family transcriptional regulator
VARTLLECMADPNLPLRSELFGGKLVIRQSTAAPAANS